MRLLGEVAETAGYGHYRQSGPYAKVQHTSDSFRLLQSISI